MRQQVLKGSIGAIAKRFGVEVHQVEYVLRSRPDLTPVGRAGAANLYDEPTVERIGHILREIAAKKHAGRQTAAATA